MGKEKEHFITDGRLLTDILPNYTNTFIAFCELLNNSIQASAKEIRISIEYDFTDKLPKKIIITDNGFGVNKTEFKDKILKIATIVKKGGQGIGRFAAFQLASKIEIETVSYDEKIGKFTKINLPLSNDVFKESLLENINLDVNYEELEGKQNSYYKVSIYDLYHNPTTKNKKLSNEFIKDDFSEAIFLHYPLHILNKDVSFYINEELIESDSFIIDRPEELEKEYTDLRGDKHKINFCFIKYKKNTREPQILFRVENNNIRTVVLKMNYRFVEAKPPIDNSWLIYVDSDLFNNNTDIFRRFEISNLDEEAKHLTDKIKSFVDEFFSEKYKDYFDFNKSLLNDEFYPYRDKEANSNTKRIVFSQFAYFVEKEYKLLNQKNKIRKVIYSLIDKSINNGDLEEILEEIVNLKDEQVKKFSELLEKTELEEVITFTEDIAKKNQFLDLLNKMVYEEPSKHVKERSELHKIIEKNLWIFGKKYKGTPTLFSDKNIENNLIKLRNECFNYEPRKEDENLIEISDEKIRHITDLFFFNEKILDNEEREIMIVELKAPKCKINQKELMQIQKYKFDIEEKGFFPGNVKYKIFLISSDLTKFAKNSIGTEDLKNPNLYMRSKVKDIEVYVIKWSDLIYENRKKLTYLGNNLLTKDIDIKKIFETDYKDSGLRKLKSKLEKT